MMMMMMMRLQVLESFANNVDSKAVRCLAPAVVRQRVPVALALVIVALALLTSLANTYRSRT